MLPLIFLGGFLLTAATSLLLTPVVRDLALQKRWIDAPDGGRKIHKRHTPRVGGLAIVAAFLVGAAYFAFFNHLMPGAFELPSRYILVGGLVIAATGFFDDVRGMHFAHKFVVQILLACVMVYGGFRIEALPIPFSDGTLGLGWWLSIPLTIVWIVGVINAVNLLDGMDGLAAGVTVIVFGSLSAAYAVQGELQSLVLVVTVVGALLGFLFYNFNPASIFMGDTGSLFIGFLLATFSLRGESHANPLLALMIPVIAMGLPVIDTGLAIVRRFLAQQPLFHPDSDHIHHRVKLRFGLSHRGTVLTLYLVSIFLGASAFMMAALDDYQATVILCFAGLATYLFLRWLGYLRVRDTLRLLRQRYTRRYRRLKDVRLRPFEENGKVFESESAQSVQQDRRLKNMPLPSGQEN